jgi:hypothetical protein
MSIHGMDYCVVTLCLGFSGHQASTNNLSTLFRKRIPCLLHVLKRQIAEDLMIRTAVVNQTRVGGAEVDGLHSTEQYAMRTHFHDLADFAVQAGSRSFKCWRTCGEAQPFAHGETLCHRHFADAGEDGRELLVFGCEHIDAKNACIEYVIVLAGVLVDADEERRRRVCNTAHSRRGKADVTIRPYTGDDGYGRAQAGHGFTKALAICRKYFSHALSYFAGTAFRKPGATCCPCRNGR